jgi:hypothetical protein
MAPERWRTLRATTGVVLIAGLVAGMPTLATADVYYPWCEQGDALHCYFTTREQCEQTVNNHGFCVANPQPQPNAAAPAFAPRRPR